MDLYNEVYEIIKNIKKIDDDNYNFLVNKYGQKVVNEVIDNLMYEDNNMYKYDYYISRFSLECDGNYSDSVKAYINDLNYVGKLSVEENKILLADICNVIKKVNGLLVEMQIDTLFQERKKLWLVDRVKIAKRESKDCDKLEELNKLYKEFLEKRNKIVEGNLRLVIFIAGKCHNFEGHFLDYIQNGNLGLMNAIEKYDSKYNVSFSTYACYWIRQSIVRNMASVLYNYKIPFNKVVENNRINRAINKLEQRIGSEPTDAQIAEYLNISCKKVLELRKLFAGTLSFEMDMNSDTMGEEEKILLRDMISFCSGDFSEVLMTKYMKEELLVIMKRVLTEREIYILTRRFGLDGEDEKTLRDLESEMHLNKETIRKYEIRAKRKVKMVGEHLYVYLR